MAVRNLKDYEVLLMNATLLGFDAVYYSKQYGIIFSKEMFKQYFQYTKYRANNKGMAAFLYFLLISINDELKFGFKSCWFPDTSTIKEFKELCVDEIRVLENKHIVHLPLTLT